MIPGVVDSDNPFIPPPPLLPAVFIAVGANAAQDTPRLMMTSDGSTWNNNSSAAIAASPNAVLQSICHNGSRWVAVGYKGFSTFGDPVVIYSDDGGITWTAATPTPTTNFFINSVCWTGSAFIAVGNDSGSANVPHVMTSPDGATWTSRTGAPSSSVRWLSVSAIGGLAIATGYFSTTPHIMTSADNGATWTSRTPSPSTGWRINGVICVSGKHIAVGTGSGTTSRISSSTDGTTWATETGPTDLDLLSVNYNGSTYVAVGDDFSSNLNPKVISSPNGSTWTSRTPDPATGGANGVNFLSIGAHAGAFVAVGRDNGAWNTPYIMHSLDGTTWTAQTSSPTTDAVLFGVGGAISGPTTSVNISMSQSQLLKRGIKKPQAVSVHSSQSVSAITKRARGMLLSIGSAINARKTFARNLGPRLGQLLVSPTPQSAAIAQFLSRTSGLDATHQNAYTNLIYGLVADGVWTKLDVLYIFATADSTTALLNLVSSSFTGVAHGSPNFVVDRGFTGVDSSSTVFIDSQFNPTTAPSPHHTTNSCHISGWSDINVISSSGGGVIIGQNAAAGSQTTIYPRYSDGNTYFDINDTVGAAISSGGSSVGHWVASRTGASASAGYKNGSSVVTINTAASSLLNVNIYVLAQNHSGGGANAGSANQVTMASIGGGLSSTDVTNFYNRLRTYMTAVGVP